MTTKARKLSQAKWGKNNRDKIRKNFSTWINKGNNRAIHNARNRQCLQRKRLAEKILKIVAGTHELTSVYVLRKKN